MYCKCGVKIPEVRVKAGYKTCVKCSTEEKWGCSQIVYHKTGNTIEVIKDKELCDEINAMAKRTGFGVSRGVKGNIRKPKESKQHRERHKNIKPSFEDVGKKTMEINENENSEKAIEFLDLCFKKNYISEYQCKKIKQIIFAINDEIKIK